jgi:hypothetical protein
MVKLCPCRAAVAERCPSDAHPCLEASSLLTKLEPQIEPNDSAVGLPTDLFFFSALATSYLVTSVRHFDSLDTNYRVV